MTNPDSLMARVLQARYYPNGSFFDAGKGSRPSATWSSILQARGLLLRGLRVRIGNGFSTGIWDTPWLKDHGNFRVFTPRPPNSVYPMRVADLIDPITQS